MAKISDIFGAINAAFPFTEAEKWDNSGLLVETDCEITKITVALDASAVVVNEAKDNGSNLIVTHHPVIFHPLANLSFKNPAVLALKNGIGIISAHTNFDIGYCSADSMFSSLLSENLSFREEGILDITHTQPHPHGFGRMGWLQKPLTSEEFAVKLKDALGADSLRYTKKDGNIRKVAFCCGGGAEYLEKAIDLGIDAYITSDVKHSTFIAAQNSGIALFTPTHYQMEKPAMKNLAEILRQGFPDIQVVESSLEAEPSQIV